MASQRWRVIPHMRSRFGLETLASGVVVVHQLRRSPKSKSDMYKMMPMNWNNSNLVNAPWRLAAREAVVASKMPVIAVMGNIRTKKSRYVRSACAPSRK